MPLLPLTDRVGEPIGIVDGGKREILTGREADMVRFIMTKLHRLRDTRRGQLRFDFGEGTITPHITESFDKLKKRGVEALPAAAAR